MFYGSMDGDTGVRVSDFKKCKLYQGFSQTKLGTSIFLFVSFYRLWRKT